MKILTTTLLLLLSAATLSAQVWARRYFDSPGDSYSAQSIIEQPAGNGYVMAGGYRPGITSSSDPLVITLLDDGLTDNFHSPFSSPSRAEETRQIIAAQGGGFLLTGDSENYLDDEPSSHYVAKLNEDYELVWKTEFEGIAQDFGTGIVESADGSIIAFGSNGKGVVTSSSGGITTISVLRNGYVTKLSSNGAIAWEYVKEDYDQCIFHHGVLLNDGKILVAGQLSNLDDLTSTQVIALLNENGEEIWLSELATEAFGWSLTPLLPTNGKIYLAGFKRTSSFPEPVDENLILHEITTSGEIVTSQEIDLGSQTNIGLVRLGNNGNIFLGGSELIDDTFLEDPFFIEMGLDGNILQKKALHTETYREFVNDLVVNPNGEILLLGVARSDFPNSESHAFLTKFSASVPTRELSATGLLPVQVYPVPASGDVHFSVEDNPLSEPFELFISDALGRVVHQSAARNTAFTLERKGLPAGAYFYRIKSGQKLMASGQLSFQ